MYVQVLVGDGTFRQERIVQAKVLGVHPASDVILCTTEEHLEAPCFGGWPTPGMK